MSIFRRRAYIEFVGIKTVIITTSFNQKRFELDGECVIDLVNLKITDYDATVSLLDPPASFFVSFFENDEGSYTGEVWAQIDEDDLEVIAEVNWKEGNKQNISLNVWTDD